MSLKKLVPVLVSLAYLPISGWRGIPLPRPPAQQRTRHPSALANKNILNIITYGQGILL